MASGLETRHKAEASQKTSPWSALCLTQTRQGENQDFWEQGFVLAHFIFPDRPTAIAILTCAVNKLKARASQEHKRAYWRDKFLKRQITRISRVDEDILQWLIFFESDSHEKAQEDLGQASEQDMVVRYVKALIQLSTGMSSFYVNIAIRRLLYRYTTSETQKIYEMVADCYREADEYRRAKRLLMLKLEERFRDRIQSAQGDHGEARYEPNENQELWCELIVSCLQMFTPWSTRDECPLKDRSGALSYSLHDLFGGAREERGDRDKIEANRCHAFIDPACSNYIVAALGLEHHSSKMGVPRFDMDLDKNSRPPSSRLPDTPLTTQERQGVFDALVAEHGRRRKAVLRELRFVVDGIEHVRFHPEHSRELHFSAPLGCQLFEVWTDDEQGPLLLATHIIPVTNAARPIEQTFALAPMNGKRVSVCLRNEPDAEGSACMISVSVGEEAEAHHGGAASRVQGWLARAPALPAYAGMLVILLVAIFLWTGMRQKLAPGQRDEDNLRTELAREREVHSSPPPRTKIAASATYRLTPDDLITRGSDEQQEHAIAVPEAPIVVNLELPVPRAQAQYDAALRPFDGQKMILAEDELSPIVRGTETVIVVPVPSTLLSPSRSYCIELRDTKSRGVRTFTFSTAPAQW
jgi:hypothetical protein